MNPTFKPDAAAIVLGIALLFAAMLGFAWGYRTLGPLFNQ